MNFVEVTYLDGAPGFVNLDTVTLLVSDGDKTFIYFTAGIDDCMEVQEQPELILSRAEGGTNDSPQV